MAPDSGGSVQNSQTAAGSCPGLGRHRTWILSVEAELFGIVFFPVQREVRDADDQQGAAKQVLATSVVFKD